MGNRAQSIGKLFDSRFASTHSFPISIAAVTRRPPDEGGRNASLFDNGSVVDRGIRIVTRDNFAIVTQDLEGSRVLCLVCRET